MTGKTGRMRYVSNAGLVLEAEGESIGIDLFSRDPSGLYPDTPPEIRQELLEEIGKGRLGTLIFTHDHGDHFCREDVWEAKRRAPGVAVISTEPVIRALQAVEGDGLSAEEHACGKLTSVPCEETRAPCWIQAGPFRIGFLYTPHEGAQYVQVPNLTLLIEAVGQHWVVPGDAAASQELFARIRRWSPVVDWFFLPFPYVGLRSSRNMLAEALEIRQVFVLHQPRPEADVQNWVGQAKRMCEHARDRLPKPVFPEGLGNWYEL